MDLSELVACTLTDTDHRTQRERWRALGGAFGLGRVETDDGFSVRFRCRPAVEAELAALVKVESECCAWARWEVERHDETLVLVVTSRSEGVAALHAMLAQF